MKLNMLLIFPAIVLLALAACSEEPVVPEVLTTVQTYMADPEAVARGEALFIGSCAEHCHTREPTTTDATYLFACEWQQETDDETMAETIRSGIPNTRMVGFGSNFPDGDDDLWKLIAFLRFNQQACD